MQNANTSELIAKLDMARAVLANPHLHIDEYGSGLNAAYKLLCDAQMIAPDNHIITSEINKLRQLSDEENNQTPNIFTFIYKNREIKIIGSNEDHIFKTICATRNYYELSMLEYIATLNIKGNMIDVGANIGNHSIFLSLLDGVKNVFCYEPSKQIYDVLKKNIQLNNLTTKTIPIQAAVGDKSGIIGVQDSDPKNLGMTKVGGEKNKVPLCRLDDQHINDNITLIKIDVEGFEPQVLNGTLKLISKYKPEIFIEAATKPHKAVLDFILQQLGYSVIAEFNATPTYHYTYKPLRHI